MIKIAPFVLVFSLYVSAPVVAQGVNDQNPGRFQGGQSGIPLSFYCNHVPDLSVQRSDSVDNWVQICSVWFTFQKNSRATLPSLPTPKPTSK